MNAPPVTGGQTSAAVMVARIVARWMRSWSNVLAL